MNPDVLIRGLAPQLCCCTAKHRSVVSHTVSMGLTKARDSNTAQTSWQNLLQGSCGDVWPWSVTAWLNVPGAEEESRFYSGQRVDHEAGSCTQIIHSEKACSPAAVFVITCPYMVQLVRHSPPFPSSYHTTHPMVERPIRESEPLSLLKMISLFYSNHNIKIESILKLALFPAALWISHIFATIPINSCALLDSMLNGSWQRQLPTLCLL